MATMSGKWACQQCTYLNENSLQQCEICTFNRPDSKFNKTVIEEQKHENYHSNHIANDMMHLLENNAGYKVSLFSNKVSALKYKCALCQQISYNAVELLCKHCNYDQQDDQDMIYCERCLKNYLSNNNQKCPTNNKHNNASYNITHYIRKKINNLIIYCPNSNHKHINHDNKDEYDEGHYIVQTNNINNQNNNNSCPWTGKLSQILKHLEKECKFSSKIESCKYARFGCNYMGNNNALQLHEKQSIPTHMDLICMLLTKQHDELNTLKQENNNLKSMMTVLSSKVHSLETTEHKINVDQNESDDKVILSMMSKSKVNIKWQDVAGLYVAKGILNEAVLLPMKLPHLFSETRKPWQTVLFYGPSGTGKSYLVNALQTEANNATFFSCSPSGLSSVSIIKNLFLTAKQKKRSIIFIDDVDNIRDNNIKTEVSVQMQCDGILVIGATNSPWDLDPEIRRRFAKKIYIGLPDKDTRIDMIKTHIGKALHTLEDNDYNVIAEKTNGFSGSDIKNVVQDASMEPLRTMQIAAHFRYCKDPSGKVDRILVPCSPATLGAIRMSLMEIPVEQQPFVRAESLKLAHFLRVLVQTKPTVDQRDIKRYVDWTQRFGQEI